MTLATMHWRIFAHSTETAKADSASEAQENNYFGRKGKENGKRNSEQDRLQSVARAEQRGSRQNKAEAEQKVDSGTNRGTVSGVEQRRRSRRDSQAAQNRSRTLYHLTWICAHLPASLHDTVRQKTSSPGATAGSWLHSTAAQPGSAAMDAIHCRERSCLPRSKPKPGVMPSRQLRGA